MVYRDNLAGVTVRVELLNDRVQRVVRSRRTGAIVCTFAV